MDIKQRREYFIRALRLSIYRSLVYFRMPSASERAIPDFLVAGAQKAGTTSLYAQIVQHPNIIPAFYKKEIHYWDNPKNYKKGQLWYRAHFPFMKDLKDASAITGEKTPNYLENPETIKRIKAEFPAVKLIILLRNPIQRTISNYYMIKKRGIEELSLMDALMKEEERLTSKKEYHKYGTERAYTIRSIYAPSIQACLENFPREQIKILDSNIFFKDPFTILKDVYRLLGVSTKLEPDRNIHRNLGSYVKDEIPQEVYDYLCNYFRPYNEELYEILGCNFGWDSISEN